MNYYVNSDLGALKQQFKPKRSRLFGPILGVFTSLILFLIGHFSSQNSSYIELWGEYYQASSVMKGIGIILGIAFLVAFYFNLDFSLDVYENGVRGKGNRRGHFSVRPIFFQIPFEDIVSIENSSSGIQINTKSQEYIVPIRQSTQAAELIFRLIKSAR